MTDEHLSLAAEDQWDDEHCPCCDTPFDTDVWSMEGHGGDAWGGSAYYECPTDDCDGSATVLY